MLINGIDFPEKILKAINEDNLVIFAGAGVSKGAPSNLPDFKGLAEEIGRQCGRVYCYKKDDIDEIVEIDEFLGDLERDYNTDVKRKVSEVLSNNAKPNDFHKNILNLFQTPEAIRIVTTNQDELFEAAMKELGMNGVNIFSAPAIPYGDDFSGIVHLHGKVSDPDHIVITDSDFGKAYMLRGYASTFLVSLFQKYTVLFVGYSYNDRIVRYLTSAITKYNIKNAYILCSEATTKLQRTNITPIPYGENKHKVLYEAFKNEKKGYLFDDIE